MTIQIANGAVARVNYSWGGIIPAGIAGVAAKDIFKFHSETGSYEIAFAATYVKTFLPADPTIKGVPDKVSRHVDAFVTPEEKNRDRKIHVSPSALTPQSWTLPDDAEGLLAHEYIHWLSHPNFYPNHYKKGGDCPFQVEGCTEWMMLECFAPGLVNIAYQHHHRQTQAWLAADPANLDRMVRFVFLGEETDLSTLRP